MKNSNPLQRFKHWNLSKEIEMKVIRIRFFFHGHHKDILLLLNTFQTCSNSIHKSDNNKKNMAEIVTEELKQIRPTEQLESVSQKQNEMY